MKRLFGRQAGSEKPAYFAGFFAVFFFGLGLCGVGGVFNIRRTIRSNAGEGRSLFGFAAIAGV
jgi:hypothetical protein